MGVSTRGLLVLGSPVTRRTIFSQWHCYSYDAYIFLRHYFVEGEEVGSEMQSPHKKIAELPVIWTISPAGTEISVRRLYRTLLSEFPRFSLTG